MACLHPSANQTAVGTAASRPCERRSPAGLPPVKFREADGRAAAAADQERLLTLPDRLPCDSWRLINHPARLWNHLARAEQQDRMTPGPHWPGPCSRAAINWTIDPQPVPQYGPSMPTREGDATLGLSAGPVFKRPEPLPLPPMRGRGRRFRLRARPSARLTSSPCGPHSHKPLVTVAG